MGRPGGRIRVTYEAVVRDLEAGSKRAEHSIDGVGDAARRTNVQLDETAVSIDRVDQSTTRYSSSARSAGRDTDSLTKKLQDANIRFNALQNAVTLIKWPALITGAGYAAQGLGVAAAGAAGLSSALAPLTGALSAYPALLGGVGQAAGVLALGQLSDLKEALGGNEEALKKLSPEARDFLDLLEGITPEFKRMRSEVQGNLFGGLSKGLKSALGNFDVLHRVMGRTSTVLGDLGRRAGEMLGRKGVGRDLETIGKGNTDFLGKLGTSGLRLASALRHVMVAAQPFLDWLGNSAIRLGAWLDGAAKAGRESGKLAGFFDQTRSVMERLGSIVESLGGGFLAIGHAAAPLGRQILAALDDAAQGFQDWTGSVEGKSALKDYFEQAKPAIFETGRLVGDVVKAFFSLSNNRGVFSLIHELRVKLLPVLTEVIGSTTEAFGPALIGALVEVGKLFGHLAGTSGPLTLTVEAVGRFVGFIDLALEKIPGLNTAVITIVGALGVAKAMKFTAAITGVSTLVDLFKDLKTAAETAAVAEEAAASPGLLGGLKKGKGKLAKSAPAAAPLGMLTGAEVGGVLAGGAAGGVAAGGGIAAAAGAAAPWIAIGAAAVAAGAGVYVLYQHSKAFRDLVDPLGHAASSAFGEVKAQVGKLGDAVDELAASFKGDGGLVGAVKDMRREFKGPLDAIGDLFGSVFKRGLEGAFTRISHFIGGIGQLFSGSVQVIRGVVEVITGILTGKFGKAWQGVKDIFGGGIKTVVGFVKAATSPMTATVKAIGGVLEDVFGRTWTRVKGIFEDGANAVIGFVQNIADVVSAIPGVPDIDLPTFGEETPGKTKLTPAEKRRGYDQRFMGGPITKPMAIVGEEAPQHPEWVIATNPAYRRNNIAYWMQAGRDLGVPGFAKGGLAGAASAVGGAIGSVVGKGAGYFIDKLPKPDLPNWLGGLGGYVINRVSDYISTGFKDKKLGAVSMGPGALGFVGAPANMQQLGDAGWVDSHTAAVIAYLANKFGLTVNSTYRSPAHNAAVGGVPGSLHTHGSMANPGAADFSPPSQAALAWAKAHIAGLDEAMIHDAGSGLHLHLGFFAKGGKIDWSKLVGSSWDNDELATLAHLVGMPNPGLMAQIAQGESRGNPSAVGHDDGGSEGLGLWQITTDVGNDDVIEAHGGRGAMFNPWLNALAAKEVLAEQGLGAWYAPPTGPRGKVIPSLAQKIRDAIAGKKAKSASKGSYEIGLAQTPYPVSMPGLPAGKLTAAAKGLPAQLQALLKQPGLSFAQKLGVAELATNLASSTKEATFDAAGNETSADSHADDIVAAKFQKELLQADKKRIEKRIREIAKRLKQKGLSQKQRNDLLAEQGSLLSRLATTKTSISSANQTIHTGPDEPGQVPEEEDRPTAMDFASRDLARAELNKDAEGERAARLRMQQIAEDQLAAAEETADPRDDIEALQLLKGIKDSIDAGNRIQEEKEAFEKERLEVQKRFLAVAESENPSVIASLIAMFEAGVGGTVAGRDRLATAGVSAGYM